MLSVQENIFCLYTFFNKQNTTLSSYKFLVEQLVISDNLLYMHNNYIAVAWLRRCKGVEISSKTFTMILCRSKIHSYVNIV